MQQINAEKLNYATSVKRANVRRQALTVMVHCCIYISLLSDHISIYHQNKTQSNHIFWPRSTLTIPQY